MGSLALLLLTTSIIVIHGTEIVPDEHPEFHTVEVPREVLLIRAANDARMTSNAAMADENGDDEDWQLEQSYTEGGMGKRSIALGRSGFRPGKRAAQDEQVLLDYGLGKRSMAIGRLGLRPGKRSLSMGRLNFRPGKRSMAYGRQGFRPGKRSVTPTSKFERHGDTQ